MLYSHVIFKDAFWKKSVVDICCKKVKYKEKSVW